jgi:two-component system chemotaxis response regulator CheY
LIVDDSRTQRRLLRKDLEAERYLVDEADGGTAALQLIATAVPHLIISDVNMDDMDGISLCRAIRTRHAKTVLPVLMLTTETTREMRDRGRDAGASGWLVKPYQPGRLIAVVDHLLGGSSGR